MKIYFCFYFNIARDVVTVLPIIEFIDIHHFIYIFTRVYTGTHTQAQIVIKSPISSIVTHLQ